MKRMSVFILFFFLVSMFSMGETEIKFKGLVQTWFSYTQQGSENHQDGIGFTLRRVRFNPYGSFSKTIKWSLQVAWDKQVAKLLDAYLDFDFSKAFKLRVGQFPVPGTVSAALTSSGKLDFIERPSITENWGDKNSLTTLRGVGIQAYGDMLEGKLYYAVMLANPNASELFTPAAKSPTYSHLHDGLAIWGRLEATPVKGLRFGAFFGTGKELHDNFKRDSYGAHFFYVKNSINFKTEYIAGKTGIEGNFTKYNGMYALFGYKIGKWEPIVQYDFFSPNDGNPDSLHVEKYNNITLGVNYFYSDNVKFQANYVIREESTAAGYNKIKNNIFYICFQYSL